MKLKNKGVSLEVTRRAAVGGRGGADRKRENERERERERERQRERRGRWEQARARERVWMLNRLFLFQEGVGGRSET